MKYKNRFQCKSDLRILRECFKLTKEYVQEAIEKGSNKKMQLTQTKRRKNYVICIR